MLAYSTELSRDNSLSGEKSLKYSVLKHSGSLRIANRCSLSNKFSGGSKSFK